MTVVIMTVVIMTVVIVTVVIVVVLAEQQLGVDGPAETPESADRNFGRG